MSHTAPMIMRMVCTKSVQITADSPPPIVKMAAMASSARIDKYSPIQKYFLCERENIFVCDYFTFLPGEVHGELDEERPCVQIGRDLGEDVQQQRQHGEEHSDTLTPEPHPEQK